MTGSRPSSAPRGPRAARGRVLLWLAAGLGAVLAVLLFMPASLFTGWVEKSSEGRVVLDDARGTVWSGSARLLLTGGEGSRDTTALPGRLEWSLRPLINGLGLELRLDCCADQPVQLTAHPRWGQGEVVSGPATLRLPLGLLGGLGTPWNTVQLQGTLDVRTQGLQVAWTRSTVAPVGQLRLEAHDVTSRLSTLRPLGSYRMDYSAPGAGAVPTLKLETLKGDLVLRGEGQWAGRRLRFSGDATATPGREAALANLLNIIGRRSGDRSIISVG